MTMITSDMKEKYIAYLAEDLSELYNMSNEKAVSVVRNSAVCKMLENEEDAQWQMHQPYDATVKHIFAEYQRKRTTTN